MNPITHADVAQALHAMRPGQRKILFGHVVEQTRDGREWTWRVDESEPLLLECAISALMSGRRVA